MDELPRDQALDALSFVRELVHATADEMLRLASDLRQATGKRGVDLVTKADHFAEERLTAALYRRFPEHRVQAEEGTAFGPAGAAWTWHIDPLDGTGNFSRGLPHWAISIGLACGSRPVLGVIYGPECGVEVWGGPGLGGWTSDGELHAATPAGEPKTWIVASDWPWELSQRHRTQAFLGRLAPRIRQFKTLGSAAVDLAHLALGRIDAYAISHIFPWDQCGGAAVLLALGYELRTWSGAEWDLDHPDIVAFRPGMWEILREAVA